MYALSQYKEESDGLIWGRLIKWLSQSNSIIKGRIRTRIPVSWAFLLTWQFCLVAATTLCAVYTSSAGPVMYVFALSFCFSVNLCLFMATLFAKAPQKWTSKWLWIPFPSLPPKSICPQQVLQDSVKRRSSIKWFWRTFQFSLRVCLTKEN